MAHKKYGATATTLGSRKRGPLMKLKAQVLEFSSCGAQSTGALDILENTIQQEPKGVSSGCSSALEDQDQGGAISAETVLTVVSPPNNSVASIPNFDVKSESCLRASSNPFLWVRPKGSSVERTAKESKLNPGAKTFSPSMLQNRMVVPNGASVSYMPGTCTVASSATAQEEISASSFTGSSMPIKFTPYNNVAFGRGGNSAPHLQPVRYLFLFFTSTLCPNLRCLKNVKYQIAAIFNCRPWETVDSCAACFTNH
ncbi:hypothetical protein OROHE_017007 [Orobanche hederae]